MYHPCVTESLRLSLSSVKIFVKSVIGATSIEGEILIMGMLSVTIFVFLIVRSASPAHNKIFGAKFLSFERAAIVC